MSNTFGTDCTACAASSAACCASPAPNMSNNRPAPTSRSSSQGIALIISSLNAAIATAAAAIPPATNPTGDSSAPTTISSGPAAAAAATKASPTCTMAGSSCATHCSSGTMPAIRLLIGGSRILPIVMPTSFRLLPRRLSCASVVRKRCSASFTSALFSAQASLAIPIERDSTSVLPAMRRSVSATRIPSSPSWSSISTCCSLSSLLSPTMKSSRAVIGSPRHPWANCSADQPDSSAKSSSSAPPPATALVMAFITIVMAVPPASAFRPTLAIAALSARILASVSPAPAPAPARRCANSTMSRSVVALLLPRATIADPNRSISVSGICTMLANCANDVAASSAVRLVAMPSIAIVSVNSRM